MLLLNFGFNFGAVVQFLNVRADFDMSGSTNKVLKWLVEWLADNKKRLDYFLKLEFNHHVL